MKQKENVKLLNAFFTQSSEVLNAYRLKVFLRIFRTHYMRINLSFMCELISVNITHIRPSGIRIWYVRTIRR